MKQVAVVARKEFLEMVRDGRFRIAAAIVLVLLLAALLIGWQQAREIRKQQAIARANDEHQWLNQGSRNPHSAAHFGKYAFKPITPISFFDKGLNSYLGIAVWLEAHYQNPFRYRPAEDATALHRFGELTASVVLQLLLPLLIILLTFSTFAGERESGTIRQLLSAGVSRQTLAFGKSLGISFALLLLLVPSVLIGVLALALFSFGSGADGLSASVGRFVVLAISYLLYYVAFMGIAIAVSAKAQTARVALLVLFAFWITNSLLIPRVVSDAAQKIHRAPSSIEFWDNIAKDMKEGIDGHDPQSQRMEEAKRMLLAQYRVEKVEDLPINFGGWSLQQGEEYGNKVFDKRYSDLWNTFEKQNRVHDFGAVLAPLLSIRSLSMSMAGTDFSHHRHFAVQAENYRRVINKMMNDDLMYNAGNGNSGYVAGRNLWEQVPDFQYELPATMWALSTQKLPLILLLLWALIGVGAAVVATRTMRLG